MDIAALFRAMRPTQWVKNILVVAAPGAAGVLTDASIAVRTLLAFVAFSLASSATYLLNDAADVDADRQHPKKMHRPIAAGQVTVQTARFAAGALAVVAIALSAAISGWLVLTLAGYLVLTTAYSAKLKHIAIVDVIAVSLGFMLRAVAGGAATNVPLTGWFYLVVSCGALLLIVGKRLGELRSAHGSRVTRPVLEQYSPTILRVLLGLAAGVGILGYILWAGAESSRITNQSALIWVSTIPYVGAILRYLWLSDQGRGESPDKLVFKDPITLTFGILWAILFGLAIYA